MKLPALTDRRLAWLIGLGTALLVARRR